MDGSLSASYDLFSGSLLSGGSVSSKSRAHASSTSLGDILEAASDHNSAILRVCCGTGVGALAVPTSLRRDLSRSAVVLRGTVLIAAVAQLFVRSFASLGSRNSRRNPEVRRGLFTPGAAPSAGYPPIAMLKRLILELTLQAACPRLA